MRKARPKRGRARLADTAASAWRRDRARATPKNFCTAQATSRLSLPPFTREAGKPGATIARVEPGPAHCGISRGYPDAAPIRIGARCGGTRAETAAPQRNSPIWLEGGGTSHDRSSKVTVRSEEHTSELQSLMRNSYAVFCLKKKTLKNKM